MGLSNKIPKRSKFIQTGNFFTGIYSADTGFYRFNDPAQRCLFMNLGYIYYLDRFNFSLNVSESNFLEMISFVRPVMILTYLSRKTRVFTKVFPLINYVDNQELNTIVYSHGNSAVPSVSPSTDGDYLMLQFTADFWPIPDVVGMDSLKAQITLNFYEVHNQDYISQWKGNTSEGKGERYLING